MTIKRKIKYEFSYYRLLLLNIFSELQIHPSVFGRPMRIIMTGALIAFSLVYIGQMARSAESGYQVRDLQNKIASLNREIQVAEVEVANYSALSYLEKNIAGLSMVKYDQVRYLDNSNSSVAINKE